MGKQKHKVMGERVYKKRGQDFIVGIFAMIWEQLSLLYYNKTMFALSWVVKNENVLNLFVTKVLSLGLGRFSKALLFCGYANLKKKHDEVPIFSLESRKQIDEVFSYHQSKSHLSKPVRNFISQFSSLSREQLCIVRESQVIICNTNNYLLRSEVTVTRVSSSFLVQYKGCILATWDDGIPQNYRSKHKFSFKDLPPSIVVMEKVHNCTYFYDRSNREQPFLIAVVVRQQKLSLKAIKCIQILLVSLFVAHDALQRGKANKSFQSHMTGFGPLDNRHIRGDRVCFYTHSEKIGDALPDCSSSSTSDFEDLIDKYSHGEVVNIILALYLWWCPSVVESFFSLSCPHIQAQHHDMTSFEKELKPKSYFFGPSSYQLYISKDYCVQMHVDEDATQFTLCYTSHPDYAISPIDFIIPEYGMRLEIEDGNLFAFRSDVMHGTADRVPTANAAYVGVLTVNKKLDRLVQRKGFR